MGVTRIKQFSQRNGKLSLPRGKQGNYPAILLYVTNHNHFIQLY